MNEYQPESGYSSRIKRALNGYTVAALIVGAIIGAAIVTAWECAP